MISALYWATALTYSAVLALMLVRDYHAEKPGTDADKAFCRLEWWVLYFCLQDVGWGLSAWLGHQAGLTAASTVFHLSTVATTYFWLDYILAYLRLDRWLRRLLRLLDGAVIALQLGLVTANLFTPVIFTVSEAGAYCPEALRPLAFLNQYLVYVAIGAGTLYAALRADSGQRRRYLAALCFSLAPILCGIFQLLYPDGPFYSIGYFVGCVIIHLFIVQDEHSRLLQLEKEKLT